MRARVLGVVVSAAMAGSAAGQSVVRGIVVDRDGNAVGGAEVAIEKLQLTATVGRAGDFAFTTVPSGRHVLVARAIGFKPDQRQVRTSGRDTILLEIRLDPAPQRLDSLVVKAPDQGHLTPAMREFEERRKLGFGRFITREDLVKREHSVLSDVLRMTAGVKLVRRPMACGGGFALATGRGGEMMWQDWMTCRAGGAFPTACYLSIYLDGIRVWTWGEKEPPNMDDTSVVSLEAIELYRGPSELPVRYQTTGSACGAILFWTRSS